MIMILTNDLYMVQCRYEGGMQGQQSQNMMLTQGEGAEQLCIMM